MSFTAEWTVGMTAFGVARRHGVPLMTGSTGWAIVGLLGAGMITKSLVPPHGGR